MKTQCLLMNTHQNGKSFNKSENNFWTQECALQMSDNSEYLNQIKNI
jgi:hypothetical protein